MPQITDRCWVEVDLDKLRANYRAIEGILRPGCQLMAVVKAMLMASACFPPPARLRTWDAGFSAWQAFGKRTP